MGLTEILLGVVTVLLIPQAVNFSWRGILRWQLKQIKKRRNRDSK